MLLVSFGCYFNSSFYFRLLAFSRNSQLNPRHGFRVLLRVVRYHFFTNFTPGFNSVFRFPRCFLIGWSYVGNAIQATERVNKSKPESRGSTLLVHFQSYLAFNQQNSFLKMIESIFDDPQWQEAYREYKMYSRKHITTNKKRLAIDQPNEQPDEKINRVKRIKKSVSSNNTSTQKQTMSFEKDDHWNFNLMNNIFLENCKLVRCNINRNLEQNSKLKGHNGGQVIIQKGSTSQSHHNEGVRNDPQVKPTKASFQPVKIYSGKS